MNVLLLDDEHFELKQLKLLIQGLCPLWQIYQASDGLQALAIAQEVDLQLALLDIRLPGKSGIVVGEELRTLQPRIALVILTAYQDFQYARQAMRIGALDYLTKPVIESELEAILVKYRDSEEKARYSDVVLKALRALHARYADKVGLTEIANLIHVNSSYLSRRFRDEVGVTATEYLVKYRIDTAKSVLTSHPDWSISKVAESCGFSSQHYFSTSFRRETGVTPRGYREAEK